MLIRSVIFDLFGTLVPAWSPSRFARLLDDMARAVDVDVETFRHQWTFETWPSGADDAQTTIRANMKTICDKSGIATTAARLDAASDIRIAFMRDVLEPLPDAIPALRSLRTQQIRLGLISNCAADVPLIWDDTRFARLIDVPVFSCIANVEKPDPQIYYLACDRLDVGPNHCLFVGDGYSNELTGATNVGIKAILIERPGIVAPEPQKSEATSWTGCRIESLLDVIRCCKN